MDISNPRRVLAVSLEGATVHLTKVIKDLTGSHPEQTSTSIAGTTHNLAIKTSYYTAEVPIWLDLIVSPEEWAESFLSPEAKEVLDVLGGLIVVFALPPPTSPSIAPAQSSQPVPPSPPAPGTTSSTTPPPSSAAESAAQTRDLLRNIGRVVQDGLGGWSWDGVSLALGVGEADDVDEWEELAAGCGLEFVQIKSRVVADRNEFGEKTGIPRVLEALESNDWAQGDLDGALDSDPDDFGDFADDKDAESASRSGGITKKDTDLDPESLDFGFDREDFEGLKRAIWTSGQEIDVAPTSAAAVTGGASNSAAITKGEGEAAATEDEKIDDEEVEKIERMMLKLSAVRDMAAGLPEDQKRRMAARAVNEVMKDL